MHRFNMYGLSNGALVERNIPIRAGERLIEPEGLPANFDVSAIKVRGQNVDIGAVTSVDSALDKPQDVNLLHLKMKSNN